jgi:putative ABC transport system permease protein
MENVTPPRWADRLLQRFCAPHLLEEVQGDLHERFGRRAERFGAAYARRQYVAEVLGFLRPAFLRRKTHPFAKLLFTYMLTNYLLTAWRQMRRQTGTTAIYVAGLTLGIACCLILFLVIRQETSYDTFHAQADRIYRVESTKKGEAEAYPGASLGLAGALQRDFPEAEKVVTISYNWGYLVSLNTPDGNRAMFKESVAFAGNALFSVFDYQWLTGNPRTALSEPNTILLTESYARKYFGQGQGESYHPAGTIGKILRLNNSVDVKVTGILKDPPANTDFGFGLLASFGTLKSLRPDLDVNNWGGWSDSDHTYVVLAKGASPEAVERRFPQMVEKYQGVGNSRRRGYQLLPLQEVHYKHNFGGRSASRLYLKVLGVIGAFLLLIACINFVNLATAQALKRSREVGVRKVLGSSRGNLVGQFLGETALVVGLSVAVAFGLTWTALPFVSELLEVKLPAALLLDPGVGLFLAALAGSVTLLAGLYPAWVLSGFTPALALKNRLSSRTVGGLTLRRGMLTLQFVVAQVLVIGTVVVTGQMRLFQSADLGFDQEAILVVPLGSGDTGALRQQLLQLPDVQNVSFSFNSASAESNWMDELLYQTGTHVDTIRTQFKMVDTAFVDTYGIKMVAGAEFGPHDMTATGPQRNVLINEVFLDRMGLQHPAQALGKTVGKGEKTYSIIGVVRDFHVNSLHQKIDPTMLSVEPQFYQQAAIKVQTAGNTRESLQRVLAGVEKIWTRTYPNELFSYQFLDEALAQAYKKENQTLKLINVFAAIALLISCLGLYGLVSFMAVQRTKEVGIRRVLGASEWGVVGLFAKEYLLLLFLAFAVAAPLAYTYLSDWLIKFEYRIDLEPALFGIAFGASAVVALLTVGFRSLKAARANPVDSLRSE